MLKKRAITGGSVTRLPWVMPGMASIVGVVIVTAGGAWWSARSAAEAASVEAARGLEVAAHAAAEILSRQPAEAESLAGLTRSLASLDRPIRLEHHPSALAARSEEGRQVLVHPLGEGAGVLVLSVEPATPGLMATAGAPGVIGLVLVALIAGVSAQAARRTGVLRRIGSALADRAGGELDSAALLISPRFGPLAESWNRLISAESSGGEAVEASPDNRRASAQQAGDLPLGALDAVPVGLLGLDEAGVLRFCNGAAAAILGLDRSTAVGSATVPGLEPIREDLRAAASGSRNRSTREFVRPDASGQGTVRATIRALRRGDEATVLVMLEDVTQQRLSEDARNAFVAQATHELRAPLTNIRLIAEEAIEVGVAEPAHLARSLNIVNTEARRLERVVSDMLSVAEIEAASMSLHVDDVPMSRLMTDLESEYGAQAADKGVSLSFRLPAKLEPIKADRDKIALLLHNLIGNAVKYTPSGGSVEVEADQGSSDLVVRVRDTGPGIAPEEHEKIFQKFYRTESARGSEVSGSGLGLALAREVARLHGGDISVESSPGRGSLFTARVPRGTGESLSRAA